MSRNREGWQKGRWALALFLMVSMTSAAAAQLARKGSSRRGGKVDDAAIEDALKPQLLNADTNPTLRYPIGSISGWSVNSLSYGWLDVSQGRIHYSVMQPAGKLNEGFDIPTGEISEVKIEMYLQFHRDKKKFAIFYLPQDRWGSIHSGPGTMAAASQGSLGTGSIYQAIKNFDRVLAMVKPPPTPPPVVVQPLVSPPPEPKPAAPPAPPVIVLSAPLGARADQTLEVNGSPLVIRGVVMDSTGIPVVTINGSPSNMRPQSTQAAEFWSDPLPLQPGGNRIEISASNSAHVEARLVFLVHYAPKAAPPNPRALAKQDIISLLQGGVPNTRIAEIIKDRGLKFSPTADDLNDIRGGGGNDELIQAIQEAAPHP